MASPDLLTIKEAAEYLRVCERTLRRIVAQGLICVLHLNGRGSARVCRTDLDVYLDDQKIKARNAWKTGEPRNFK